MNCPVDRLIHRVSGNREVKNESDERNESADDATDVSTANRAARTEAIQRAGADDRSSGVEWRAARMSDSTIIIGAGHAGTALAFRLRDLGYEGDVVLVGE